MGLDSSLSASTWESPIDVSPSGINSSAPQIVVASKGTLGVTWSCEDAIQVSTLALGAIDWSPPATFRAGPNFLNAPQIAAAPDGTLTVAWLGADNPNSRIEATTLIAGASRWSEPMPLSPSGPSSLYSAHRPQIVATPGGSFLAVWNYRRRLQASVLHRGGQGWSAPVDIFREGDMYPVGHRIGVGHDGGVTIAWFDAAADNRVAVATADSRLLHWSSPAYVSNPVDLVSDSEDFYADDDNRLEIAANPLGGFAITWCTSDGTNTRIYLASQDATTRSWSHPIQLSIDANSTDPEIAFAPNGSLAVVWMVRGKKMLVSTRDPKSARWSSPTTLPGGAGDFPTIVGSFKGGFAVAWAGDKRVDVSTTSEEGGPWVAPLCVSPTGETAFEQRLAVTSGGKLAVAYTRWDGASFRVQVATES